MGGIASILFLGSIGFYANGCLDGGARLSDDSPGLVKIMAERDRRFGNESMIRTLTDLGRAYVDEWRSSDVTPYERLQVGDIAQEGGGQITHHASHQTGLDVDLVYFRNDRRETRPDRGFESGFDEQFVKNGAVTPNFDVRRNWWALRWLHRTGLVDRVFVDRAIKKRLCHEAEHLEAGDHVLAREVLRMLRPYPDHADHFHMRLLCPASDEKCVGSAPPPPGAGCTEAELNRLPKQEHALTLREPPEECLKRTHPLSSERKPW
jgi:penicillin-insensitive murein endopeptidase